MGNNLMRCCVGVAVIRIMRPNGRIDEFDVPVTASEIMQRYPQHLVIHANYLERDASFEQQRRKVSIVRPETKLLPGHEYILYPIPPQYKETVAQSFAKQLSTSLNPDDNDPLLNSGEELHAKQQLKRNLSRRSQVLEATRHHLATILQSVRDSRVEDQGCGDKDGGRAKDRFMCTEGRARGNVGDYEDDRDEDDDFSFYCSASWKPSLYSIPESPFVPAAARVRRHFSPSPSATDGLDSEHG